MIFPDVCDIKIIINLQGLKITRQRVNIVSDKIKLPPLASRQSDNRPRQTQTH